jgi:putative ABC transport system permease protein
MDTLRQDTLFAFRSLARSPGVTLAAVVCLALGVGATTTTYTATRALVLHPVPAVDADRLMWITERGPNAAADQEGVSAATFFDWQEQAGSFIGLAAYRAWNANLTGTAEPERVIGHHVSARFFELLGAKALLGRTITESDVAAGETRLVVLGHGVWQRAFAGDRGIIGGTIILNGLPYVVVGVMGADFIFPPGGELWAPLALSPVEARDRGSPTLDVIGRLRDDVAVGAAQTEIATIQARIAAAYPRERARWTAQVIPIQTYYSRNPRPFVLALMGSVSLVLLIACSNVANLLIARATVREREVAVRMAMGAGHRRIVRQLLTESVVLALVAGAAGTLLALWGVLVFRGAIPAELVKFNPGWTRIRVDLPALGFTLLICLSTAVLFGLAPALAAARRDMLTSLREGGRGGTAGPRRRFRSMLVVGQLALALTLVVTTGLMIRSFVSLLNADVGFERERVLSMGITLPEQAYPKADKIGVFYDDLQHRMAALRGVAAVGLTSIVPMDYEDFGEAAASEGQSAITDAELPIVRVRFVNRGYFDALQIPFVAGRNFESSDGPDGVPVAIVSELLSHEFWPGQDPIGKRIRLADDQGWLEVVGVVGDIRHNPNAGGRVVAPTIHLPQEQLRRRDMTVLLRTTTEPTSVAEAARRELAALDPTLAPGQVYTMDRWIHNALAPQRTTTGMLAAFGVIAVVLASVGIYGLMSYTVRRRADEIGVRMALGARGGDIIRMVLRQGLALIASGIGFGLLGALALGQVMQATLLQEVTAHDPATFVAGTAFLGAVALFACWIPARRAARNDPARLLRYE